MPLRNRALLPMLGWLLLCFPFGADDPAPTIHNATYQAIRKAEIERTPELGRSTGREAFDEVSIKGGILVGFDCGLCQFQDREIIAALRPVYRTPSGLSFGRDYGKLDGKAPDRRPRPTIVRIARLRAKPGFAVGGIQLRTSQQIEGLSLLYHRIDGNCLEPTPSFRSEWVGNTDEGKEETISTNGLPVVGVFGHMLEGRGQAGGLGLISPKRGAEGIVPSSSPSPRRDPPRGKSGPGRNDTPGEVPSTGLGGTGSDDPEDPESDGGDEAAADQAAPPTSNVWNYLLPLLVFVVVCSAVLLPVMFRIGRRRAAMQEEEEDPLAEEQRDQEAEQKAEDEKADASPDEEAITKEGQGELSTQKLTTLLGKRLGGPGAPPFVSVRIRRRWARLYVTPDALLVLDVGVGKTNQATSTGAATGGLLGALVGEMIDEAVSNSNQQKMQSRQDGLDLADPSTLLRIAKSGGHNSYLPVADIRSASVDAPAWYEAFGDRQGILRIQSKRKGNLTFDFVLMDQLQEALALLPEALDKRLQVNVVLDRRTWRYVRA